MENIKELMAEYMALAGKQDAKSKERRDEIHRYLSANATEEDKKYISEVVVDRVANQRQIINCFHFDTSRRNTSAKVLHGSLSVSMAQRFVVMLIRSIPSRKIFSIVPSRRLDNALALCS